MYDIGSAKAYDAQRSKWNKQMSFSQKAIYAPIFRQNYLELTLLVLQ